MQFVSSCSFMKRQFERSQHLIICDSCVIQYCVQHWQCVKACKTIPLIFMACVGFIFFKPLDPILRELPKPQESSTWQSPTCRYCTCIMLRNSTSVKRNATDRTREGSTMQRLHEMNYMRETKLCSFLLLSQCAWLLHNGWGQVTS